MRVRVQLGGSAEPPTKILVVGAAHAPAAAVAAQEAGAGAAPAPAAAVAAPVLAPAPAPRLSSTHNHGSAHTNTVTRSCTAEPNSASHDCIIPTCISPPTNRCVSRRRENQTARHRHTGPPDPYHINFPTPTSTLTLALSQLALGSKKPYWRGSARRSKCRVYTIPAAALATPQWR
jgi:hypothetical protein